MSDYKEGVLLKTAKLFTCGGSQAVCIPKEYEFTDVTEVHIFREGDALFIKPAKKTWSSLAEFDIVDADFLLDRVDVVDDLRGLQ